jgi:hypothetical protein
MSNFVVIQGDQTRKVEKSQNGQIHAFVKDFTIEDTDSGKAAVVLVMVKGLTQADDKPVAVAINGKTIGYLYPNHGADSEAWFTQIINFSASEGSLLPNAKNPESKNTLEIPAPDSEMHFKRFYVQNIVCFYKPQA